MTHPRCRVTRELPAIVIELIVRRQLIELLTQEFQHKALFRDSVEQNLVQLLEAVPARLIGDGVVALFREPDLVYGLSVCDLRERREDLAARSDPALLDAYLGASVHD